MVVRERHARSSIMHGAFWGGLLCGGTAPQEGAKERKGCAALALVPCFVRLSAAHPPLFPL